MNILTFDIEEWFHCDFISDSSTWNNYEVRIHRNTDLILETLDIHRITGTFFILGWIAERYPEVVTKISGLGHEIACHSYMHELVYQMNPESFKKDTESCLKLLEDITGKKVDTYRAPGFSITEKNMWAFRILVELGIKNDSSVFPGKHDYGGFPSFGEFVPTGIVVDGKLLKEFPLSKVSVFNKNIVFSGGGYFRLFPYSLIKSWVNDSDYMMSYFHPRDFDFDQPRLSHLPALRRFKSYIGLKNAYPKFQKFITEFQMMSICQASHEIDWGKVKIISF
jgi:peptidoglycan-N-acetylglucosamine deacetylase